MHADLPPTERREDAAAELDLLPTDALVAHLLQRSFIAFDAARANAFAIAGAVERAAELVRVGGRLHYAGAGTSGRIAALDAAELAPTFGVASDFACMHLAGGERALRRAIEGAEDDARTGADEVAACVRAGDVLLALSASGRTPYTVAAVLAARERGAFTVALTADADAPLAHAAESVIALETGAEPLAGSTRMNAATAQKLALNAFSTALMVRLGRVLGNRMVGVVPLNAKLRVRAVRLVEELTGLPRERAEDLLARAGGEVRVAVVMGVRGLAPNDARAVLDACGGDLRAAIARR